ncbi:MAG: hypothetical protein ACOYNN_18285 [Terrimicrobiaceae bacterium]
MATNGTVTKKAIVRHVPTDTHWLVDAKIDLDKLGMSGPMKRAIKRAVEGDGTATCLGGSVKLTVKKEARNG